ncbi:glycoside hydrolase 5 family protein [Ancrocorticia populi]|uniref:glycoside hydrolase 5 family protein n=1 Tax=Ancrocorticia populi TaxID=2175228 RepID=UPI003F8E9162
MANKMHMGVNYIPSQGWLYSWYDWSAQSIRADLTAIASSGVDHVRVHCIWPIFQPNRHRVSPTALAHLRELVTIAGDLGLEVSVCVLNGWMSGIYFRPFWQVDGASVFTDPQAITAERDLLTAVIDATADLPGFMGIDIGNEPNCMSMFAGNSVTREQGDAWATDLLQHCETLAPEKFHVAGVDHSPWLSDDSCFSRPILGQIGQASVVHSWVFFTGALERYGSDGVGTLHLARYLTELARAFGDVPDRPVWIQEVGLSEEWVAPDELPSIAGQIVDNAAKADPWGITWWCSHDIDRSLSGFASLEYGLGLFDTENRLKPVGQAVKEAISRNTGREAVARPSESSRPALHLPSNVVPDLDFADEYFAMVARGEDPEIKLVPAT